MIPSSCLRRATKTERKRTSKLWEAIKIIFYADNAATTKPSQKVIETMNEVYNTIWGNPSSIHSIGARAKSLVKKAREKVAEAINANPNEIYFTSGGTEANNWAIKGFERHSHRRKIVTSAFEHHSILNACEAVKDQCNIQYAIPRCDGRVHAEDLGKILDEETGLVSIMAVNNELGTIQPIDDIAELCKERKCLFHTDAVQAIGNIPIDVTKTGIDLLSLSGHKFHASQGIGVLFIKEGTKMQPLIYGGQQESHLRAGTENVAAIAGIGVAIEEAMRNMSRKEKQLRMATQDFIRHLVAIPCTSLNVCENRIAGTVSVSFKGVEANTLILWLSRFEVYASSGSACDSQNYEVSHVLKAIGLPRDRALGTIRFSFGDDFTQEDVPDLVGRILKSLEYAGAF